RALNATTFKGPARVCAGRLTTIGAKGSLPSTCNAARKCPSTTIVPSPWVLVLKGEWRARELERYASPRRRREIFEARRATSPSPLCQDKAGEAGSPCSDAGFGCSAYQIILVYGLAGTLLGVAFEFLFKARQRGLGR